MIYKGVWPSFYSSFSRSSFSSGSGVIPCGVLRCIWLSIVLGLCDFSQSICVVTTHYYVRSGGDEYTYVLHDT
jgi:hypothetical protein